MSNGKPSKPNADALAKDLRDTLAQRRPRRWRPALVTLAAALVLTFLIAYGVVYRRAPATSLQVLALDDVFATTETPRAQAQLLAPLAEQATRRVRGETVVFVEQQLPGAKPRESVATSDGMGKAFVEWPITSPLAEFQVRYIVPPGSVDRGLLFVWPKETPLLIVDAEETLIGDAVDAKAITTLTRAYEEGWRVVYLALAGTNGFDFKKSRDWIVLQPRLPRGPVLGRKHYPNKDEPDAARRDVLKTLQGRFKAEHVAIVKNAPSATLTKDLGIRVVQLGAAMTWDSVATQLKR